MISEDPISPGQSDRRLATLHGVYYLLSGIWPLVSIRSFEAVTGPKTDRWLVKTVGVLVASLGAGLVLAGNRRRVTPDLAVIAGSSALGLAAIEAVTVAQRRIRWVYLLDAALELGLAAAWARTRATDQSSVWHQRPPQRSRAIDIGADTATVPQQSRGER